MSTWWSGWKSYLAAAILGAVAVNRVLHWWPSEWDDAILTLAASLGIVGLRSAIGQVSVVQEKTARVVASETTRERIEAVQELKIELPKEGKTQ